MSSSAITSSSGVLHEPHFTDISALASMKNVAKCNTWCELQNPVNHRVFERQLCQRPLGRGHVCLGVTHRRPHSPRLTRAGRILVSRALPLAVGPKSSPQQRILFNEHGPDARLSRPSRKIHRGDTLTKQCWFRHGGQCWIDSVDEISKVGKTGCRC